MGRCEPRADSRSCKSGPLRPGILMSRRMQLGPAPSRQSLQQLFRRFISLNGKARGAQKTLGRGAERRIIINDVHDG